ncbi:hypothetical protein WMY93_009245 [Mugilogobius chulae]|uniref:Uncharacterized protein n=1 Tax=Mugilogobius chulae TaxID=88201 RepID=A0AAW0PEE2_9GOBI
MSDLTPSERGEPDTERPGPSTSSLTHPTRRRRRRQEPTDTQPSPEQETEPRPRSGKRKKKEGKLLAGLTETDFLRVRRLLEKKKKDEQDRIQSLNLQECRDLLQRCLDHEPSLLFDIVNICPPY